MVDRWSSRIAAAKEGAPDGFLLIGEYCSKYGISKAVVYDKVRTCKIKSKKLNHLIFVEDEPIEKQVRREDG